MVMIETFRLDPLTLQRVLDKALERARNFGEAAADRMAEQSHERLPISEEFAAIRALTPPGPQEDSVALIRALRDE